MDEPVQHIDAAQSVLVGRIAVEKLVLNQVGQLSKFREVATEETVSVHAPKNMSYLAAVLEDLFEGFPIRFIASEVAVDEMPVLFEETSDFGAGAQMPTLSVQEEAHEALRVLGKDIVVLRINQSTLFVESVERFAPGNLAGKEVEDRNPAGVVADHFKAESLHQRCAVMKQVSGMTVEVAHEAFASTNDVLAGIFEIRGDNSLEAQGEDVSGTPFLRIVKLVADAHEKFVGFLDFFECNVSEPVLFNKCLKVA